MYIYIYIHIYIYTCIYICIHRNTDILKLFLERTQKNTYLNVLNIRKIYKKVFWTDGGQ